MYCRYIHSMCTYVRMYVRMYVCMYVCILCKLVSLLTSLCRLIGCAIWGLLEVRTYINILSNVIACLLNVKLRNHCQALSHYGVL